MASKDVSSGADPAAPEGDLRPAAAAAPAPSAPAAAAAPPPRPKPKTPFKPSTAPVLRKDVNLLRPEELEAYRKAMKGIQEGGEKGEFYRIAGLHGYPSGLCQHHRNEFPFWHRAYLLELETALQKIVPGVAVPYWDWESEDASANGLPKAFTDKQCMIDNVMVDNPLCSYTIPTAIPLDGLDDLEQELGVADQPADKQENTIQVIKRDPQLDVPGLRRMVDTSFLATDYVDFSNDQNPHGIEAPHDNVHGELGDQMSVVDLAAFDPIFWSHHCNVDRLIASWQELSPNNKPKPGDLDENLVLSSSFVAIPENLTVDNLIDYKALFTYQRLRGQTWVGTSPGGVLAAASKIEAAGAVPPPAPKAEVGAASDKAAAAKPIPSATSSAAAPKVPPISAAPGDLKKTVAPRTPQRASKATSDPRNYLLHNRDLQEKGLFDRPWLVFRDLQLAQKSGIVGVFLNSPCDPGSAWTSQKQYAGSITVFSRVLVDCPNCIDVGTRQVVLNVGHAIVGLQLKEEPQVFLSTKSGIRTVMATKTPTAEDLGLTKDSYQFAAAISLETSS